MKKKIISMLTVCVLLIILSIPAVFKANDDNAFAKKGEKISDIVKNQDADQVVFSAKEVEVTKGELTAAIIGNMDQGKTKEEIIESAIKLVVTKKSLYAEAVKSGIKVTDEEYKAYKNLVKDSLENAENKEDIQAYFDGFGGEENYWKQMKVVIMENLAIRKYMNELTQNESDIVGYSENNNYDDIVQQQNMEQQIKDNVYDETLSEQEKEKLKEVAGDLYEEVEKTSK